MGDDREISNMRQFGHGIIFNIYTGLSPISSAYTVTGSGIEQFEMGPKGGILPEINVLRNSYPALVDQGNSDRSHRHPQM